MASYPTYPQQYMPIVFLLFGPGLTQIPILVPFGIPEIGLVRPEHISIHRRSRGAIMQTAGAAVLDDFGEGPATLLLQGNTGWRGSIISGLTGFKLIELLFIEYLRRRARVAAQGLDPNGVRLWYLDVVNVEAFDVYPHEATFDKDRQRPLLYFYRIRATVLRDLLQQLAYEIIPDFLSGIFSGSGGSTIDATMALADAFPVPEAP